MINEILKLYWAPKNTPLYKHNLPSILTGTILLSLLVAFDVITKEKFIPLFILGLGFEVGFSVWARARFGDKNPN